MRRVGTRAKRKAEVRAAIVRAALRLFRRRGFDETTVDEIAAAAGVSRRTFFRYFERKEVVAFPWHAERLELFRDLVARRYHGESAIQAVRRALIALAHEYERNREQEIERERLVQSSATLVARERDLDLRWEAVIAEALLSERHRVPRKTAERRARMLAAAIVGVARAVIREWVASEGHLDFVELGLEGFDLVVRPAKY